MSVQSNVKQLARVDYRVVGSVVAGLALFGGLVFLIRMLPSNAVTTPVKKVANIAAG